MMDFVNDYLKMMAIGLTKIQFELSPKSSKAEKETSQFLYHFNFLLVARI
jgi:hypothetical protein